MGIIVHVEDSLITHLDSGFAQVSNSLIDYETPFDIEQIVVSISDALFSDEKVKLEIINIDRRKWVEYNHGRKKYIYNNDFKKYRQEWFENIMEEYNVNAFIVLYNSELNLTVGMNNVSVETQKICFSTFGNHSKSKVHIKLKGLAFWESKPKNLFSTLIPYYFLNEELNILPSSQTYTKEELVQLQKPFTLLIEKQLREMKRTNGYAKMSKEFRRIVTIEKYNKQLEGLKK